MWKSAAITVVVGLILYKAHFKYKSIVIDEPEDEYDFIVVGGGTAGSVVASRLTENCTYKVLVLEAGSESLYDPLINIPLLTALNQGRWVDWKFRTESISPAPYLRILKENAQTITRGKTLGGTSAVNYQLYSRGSPEDFESWAHHGGKDWQYENVLPYFKKSETSQHIYPIDENFHGDNGPLRINHLKKMGITKSFIEAAQELGLQYLEDHNAGSVIGVGPLQTTVYNGVRQSSAMSFLYPIAHSRKGCLHIVANAHVTKVNFVTNPDGRKVAIGVAFSKYGVKRNVTALKEVILSAGVFGTPQILMLSGIGPQGELEKHKIDVIQNLPGVGKNYQDHIFLPINFHAGNITYGDLASLREIIYTFPEWLINGYGPLGTAGMAIASLKVPNSLLRQSVPDIQALLVPTPTTSSQHSAITSSYNYKENAFAYDVADKERNGVLFSFFLHAVLLHPKSSGTVKLRSVNPFDKPVINPNIYSNLDDMKTMIEGIKWIISLENTDAFKSKQAKFVNILQMCDDTVKNEKFYECLVKSESQLYHGCCTAKLGNSSDEFAVVDNRLRVFGVHGLRIADASIMPEIISGPTQGTCFMIGEKVASLIKEAYGQHRRYSMRLKQ